MKDCGLGRTHAEAAFMHERRCSLRCGFVSSSQSPTTNEETIREAP
ncbi:transposase ISH11 [Halorubrum sp. AJ67]|nr:transposase ISH11 [Halorubrum sp. AJ67]